QGFELTNQSNDRLLSLMAKALETMNVFLSKGSDRDNIICSLLELDSQRSITMRFENSNSDPVRTMVFGLIQSLQATLLEQTE
ncbi:hypothetical protein PMAYCL1PPCAC_07868, partial [Pristionchus mayeri]